MQDHPRLSSESRMLLVMVGDDFQSSNDFAGWGVDLLLRAFDLHDPETEGFLQNLNFSHEDMQQSIKGFLAKVNSLDVGRSATATTSRKRLPSVSIVETITQKARWLAQQAQAEFVTPSHLIGATVLTTIERSPKNPITDAPFQSMRTSIFQSLGIVENLLDDNV